MDILKIILSDTKLKDKIYNKCDIEIYAKMKKPEDMNGCTIWNIDGMAFACDGSGGEFVLLSDGTIGFNSSEGETGRIAKNMTNLFSLLINCPCFHDFLIEDLYKDEILLKKYADAIENEYREDFNQHYEDDWDNIKTDIATMLGFSVDNKICENTLKKFYETAKKEPQYQYTYEDTDGTRIISECIISRPMRDWIKEKAGL